jgi:Protein of unknown function (DUF3489)
MIEGPEGSRSQAILLTAAAQRTEGNLLPLPGSLRGGAATKVVAALLARGLVEERTVETTAKADPALNTLWRNLDDGRGTLLRITPSGLDALGIDADSPAVAATGAESPTVTTKGGTAAEARPQAAPAARSGKTREGTKQALLVEMLGRPDGASIDEIVAATGWQPHTVRGAFAGALKKRLGLDVTSEKVDGRGRVYRL